MNKNDDTGDELHLTDLPEDDNGAPDLTDDGLLALLNPADQNLATDGEDDDVFDDLADDESPGETQRVLDTMRPLSDEEKKILDDLPGLEGLRKVDDAEQEQWLLDRTKDGYTAMDKVLDDATYGEDIMDEKDMPGRSDGDDVGFGIPGLSKLKKIATLPTSLASRAVRRLPGGKYADRLARAPMSAASWARKKTTSTLMRYVPGRDGQKAQVVRNLYRKLVGEHANFLGRQDQAQGLTVQPRSYYLAKSAPWAKSQIARAGLPTTFAVSGADVLGAEICGTDVMGSWWNPLAWFFGQSQVVVNNTQGERSATGPDADPNADPNAAMDPSMDPSADPAAADPYAANPYAQQPDPGYQDPNADAYSQGETMEGILTRTDRDDQRASDPTTGIAGEDSLGAFATEILSGASPSKKPGSPKADRMIKVAVDKLRSGQPVKPGELAVIARLAKDGHPAARSLYATLLASGVSNPSTTTSGAWLHKLNPGYWFKPAEERALKDREIEAWKENAELQKKLGKRQDVLAQAERAKSAADAVRAAQEQAAATEAQLKAIESSIKGELVEPAKTISSGTFVGHENPTPISKVVQNALAKAGKLEVANQLYAKILAGRALTGAEAQAAAEIAKILQRVKVVHGDLYAATPAYLTAVHGAFVGGCMLRGVDVAREKNQLCARAATVLGKRLDGQTLSECDERGVLALAQKTRDLRQVVHAHAAGKVGWEELVDRDSKLSRSAACGAAAAAMTPAEAKMLAALRSLAKAGNPRAVEGLRRLRASGAVVGGDLCGSAISDTFRYATAPIWLPAKHLYKGAKWTGQKLGIVSKGGSSPEQQRLAMLRAAAARRKASEARAAAADAQTQAELRAQEAIAAAADADADAADAEALSKEAAMRTREVEADPSLANQQTDDAESFSGSWEAFVGEESKKIATKAKAKDGAGIKIRAGAKMYQLVRKGDPKAKAALKTMIAKSQKGDAQATRDLRVVYAGMKATKAREKAQKKEARALASNARRLKVAAVQRRFEAAAANKLVRAERRVELARLSRVERKAAAGDPKARAFIAKQVELAKKGDKKAQQRVQKLRLAKNVRQAAPTARERRNLAAAGHLLARAQKGNPKAVRQVLLVQAAAKQGNPNAKRAVRRLQVAKVVAAAVATGAVTTAVLASKKDKKHKMTKSEARAKVAAARSKAAAGTGSREELAAGAKAAAALGDRKTAGELAVAAAQAPSATETLKKTAAVVAAKEAGNPTAREAINKNFEEAKSGDPNAIRNMGNVVAAQTIDDIQKGRPVSPAMRDAVNLQERVAEGDPKAIAEVKKITEAATTENPAPEATAAAVTLAAAAVAAKALAAKPSARKEFLAKVNPPLSATEQTEADQKLAAYVASAEAGTISADEAQVAERLAERLGKHKVAAKIAALAPPPDPTTPLSTLPDLPQPAITGIGSLLRESLRALAFATRDPLANYREGVATRAKSEVVRTAGSDTLGWSPFGWFRQNLAVIAPSTALAASATSLATALAAKKGGGGARPAPAPAPAPSPEPAAAVRQHAETPAPAPAQPTAAAVQETSSGNDVRSWDSDIPVDIKNNPVVRDMAKIIAYGTKLRTERAQKGDSFDRDQLSKMVVNLKQLSEEARKGDKRHCFTYWQEIMAATMSPIRRAVFAKIEPDRKIPVQDNDLLKPFESNAYGKAGVSTAKSNYEKGVEVEKVATSSGDEADQPGYRTRLTKVEVLHFNQLWNDFDNAVARSITQKTPFKNPLTNKDMAWLYRMRVKEQDTSLSQNILNDLGLSRNDLQSVDTFLKEIDKSLAAIKARNIPIISRDSSSGDAGEPSFKDYVANALTSKKMSKRDFNRAVVAQTGSAATEQTKLAVGQKMLDFLTKKGVKVET